MGALAPAELAEAARAAGQVAIDTEFVSERRYRPLLCLVQVGVPRDGEVHVEVLDALDGFDPAPLAGLLADPGIEVLTHAGYQDVAILRREWRTDVTAVFDTQVAAGFAGFPAQAGYETLLRRILDVRLAKTASFTRWDRRPLTPEQLAYAREDVVHLPALAGALQERLRESGRLEWAREEAHRVERASDERDPLEAYRRLPRIAQLDPRARAVARELAAWRERTAAELNRPVGHVFPDASLVEVARRKPTSAAEMEQIRGVDARTVRRRADEMLAAIERGRAAEPIAWEEEAHVKDPGEAPLVALGEALVRSRALEAGLAYELIASRPELARVVRGARDGGGADARVLEGWRRDLVGEELLDLLAGRRTLAVGPDGTLSVTSA